MTSPTNPSALDRAFARFRETGDPAALGEVFDATAPELLRLASHLISDLGLAEDLVQATFLAAIQSCRDYDARKPVLPWLVGILTNRARLQRRARGRQPDPDRLERTGGPDPAEAAEAKELTRAVTDAIAGMPEPYRPVLMMHLRHGFSAQEIALTLGRAPGSVRKQLSRGLDLLRRALPAGLAVTVSSAILPTQGLAAMRDVVLAAAKLATQASAATAAAIAPLAIGGAVLMKKTLIATAILGVASVGYLVWPDPPAGDGPAIDAASASPAGPLVGGTDTQAPSTGAPSLAPRQSSRQRLADPGESLSPGVTVLRGRCVDRSSGLPLAGCKVRLHGWVRNTESLEGYIIKHGDVQWEDPQPQITGKDGRFAFKFVPPPPHQFMLDIAKEGLVLRRGRWSQLQPGTTKDLEDISLCKGAIVTGRILDPEGRPLAAKEISFRLKGGQKRLGDLNENTSVSFRSHRDGAFSTRTPIESGTWRNALQDWYNDDRYSVEPAQFTIVPGQGRIQIDFVFRAPAPVKDCISGQVLDESGQPVRGVEVSGINAYGLFGIGRTLSGKDGRFRIGRSQGQSKDPMPLGVTGKGFETLTTKKKYSWGTEKIKLVVRHGLRLDILVKDGETGEPVEEFGLRCFRDADAKGSRYPNPDFSLQRLGTHPGGRLFLEGIRRGKNVLLVEPRGENYLPSGFRRFTVTDQGAATQVISLYRSTERPLKVVGSDGSAVAGSRIELLAPITSEAVDLRTRIIKRTRMNYWGGRNRALLICSGRTNAAGEFLLTGRPREKFALRLLGPGHQAMVVEGVVLDPKLGTLRVEVPRGATLVGRLSPQKLLEQFRLPLETVKQLGDTRAQRYVPHIGLRRAGTRSDWFPSDMLGRAVIADDGRFELVGIPPGDWDLYLRFYVRSGEGSCQTASEPLVTVRGLEQGKRRELSIDVSHLAAGKLNGRIYVNGLPVAGARFSLYGSKPDGRGGTRSSALLQNLTTDKSGAFSLQVHPATYHLRVFLPKEHPRQPTDLPSPGPVVITAGQVVDHVFQLCYRSLRLRVLASDGRTPLEGVEVEAHMPGTQGWRRLMPKTDATGATARVGMPCGPLEFRIWPKHLSDPQAQDRLRREDQDAWESARILLGTRRLVPGEGEFLHQLVLPASSGY